MSICPSSIRPMIRVKSAGRALREQSSVPSGLWKTGCRNWTSSVVIPTNTSRPPWAMWPKALDIEATGAGGVDHDVGQVAVGQVAQVRLEVVGEP